VALAPKKDEYIIKEKEEMLAGEAAGHIIVQHTQPTDERIG